ncbi:hypothetical protein JP39_11600 [Companilactobacillus heilongjiangensis]|uniref:Uncharacterized protein n=1 Tax=Companilactobacillus heilongjiangensis TaxID=1074467 RepID=A0A0K2LF73_9LACO|nr:hypothetical protein JP39_11600 [Companilactobacillus heilongjiangensis]
MEELRVFIRSESGVIALAITPPDVLETFRFLESLQPRPETALWLGPCRATDEYSQLWKRQTNITKSKKKKLINLMTGFFL